MVRWIFVVSFLAAMTASGGAFAGDPKGLWLTDRGKAKIEIAPCGALLCSKIVWLSRPHGSDGEPVRDRHNPDPQLKNRPVVGLATFSGLRKKSPNMWSGRVYNPEDGKTYMVQLTLVEEGVIHVSGCRAGTMECGQRVWRRVGR